MLKSLLSVAIAATFAITAFAGDGKAAAKTAAATTANEAEIKKAIEAKLGAPVQSLTKAGYLGLYEIYLDGQILYTDEKASTLIVGNLVDLNTMKNVTKERMAKLNAIKFSDLPLERAIKIVRGNGKRVMATFEDPNCGYCKRLAKDIQKLDNVTIYTFLLPILSEDSIKKAKQIWCASDRVKTWNDWMVENKLPEGKDDCDTSAIAKNQEYGHKLNITGTPTLVFSDGERIPGAVPFPQIEQKLGQLK